MGLVRHHAGYHQRFTKMHGKIIAAVANRVGNQQGLGSLPRCSIATKEV